jgi:hypothetical protein
MTGSAKPTMLLFAGGRWVSLRSTHPTGLSEFFDDPRGFVEAAIGE